MPWWLQLFLLLCLATAAAAGLSTAPWVPTRKKERDTLISSLSISPEATLVDLGAGTGTLLFAYANAGHTGRLIGYEISLLPYLFSLARKLTRPYVYRNISLRYRSLFRADLSQADVVLCFLLPTAYPKLVPWLHAHARTQSMIVVQGWPLPDWPNEEIPSHRALSWFVHKVQ